MPWQTPTLDEVRSLNRDAVTAQLRSSPLVPNSVARVMADSNAGLAFLVLLYIDWLSKQFLPDTSETEWLDRHANLWLVNADGTKGRKHATFAIATINAVGINGIIVPAGTELTTQGPSGAVVFQTTEQVAASAVGSPISAVAVSAGRSGLAIGAGLEPAIAISGVSAFTMAALKDGIDEESDDELRARVLFRIQEPPMGGDSADYVRWAMATPGVTRAWCYPNEMGIGTVTVRFMCDDLRADNRGFPTQDDVNRVSNYIDTVRPVTVKDHFIVSPLPFPLTLTIRNLDNDTEATRQAIAASLDRMMQERAAPGQTVYASWVDEAISTASGENHHDLIFYPLSYEGTSATDLRSAPGSSFDGTSNTDLSVLGGVISLTTNEVLAYVQGHRVRLKKTDNPTNIWMEGLVQSYDGTTMVVNVDDGNGYASEASSWVIARGIDAPSWCDRWRNYQLHAQTFITQAGLGFLRGARLKIASRTADTALFGAVISYEGNRLAVMIDSQIGEGLAGDWNISIVGDAPVSVSRTNATMPSPGHMPVIEDIIYE